MKKNSSQNTDRLNIVLQAYGADASRWPAAERGELLEQLENREDQTQALLEAQNLDSLLEQNTGEITPSSALMGAILQDAAELHDKKSWSLNSFRNWFFKPASGLVFAVSLGILIGFVSPNILMTPSDVNLDEISISDSLLDWQLENNNG